MTERTPRVSRSGRSASSGGRRTGCGATRHRRAFAPDAVSEIEVFDRYRAGLGDLAGISHLHVFLWFGHARRDALEAHPPHLGGATLPVFCTRSPARPNPIGLNLAEVLSVRDGVITVAGMDAFEGMPVLDLKPYIPSIDCVPGAWDMLAEDS